MAPVMTMVLSRAAPPSTAAVSAMVSVPCVMTICDSGARRQLSSTRSRLDSCMSRLSMSWLSSSSMGTVQRTNFRISGRCESLNVRLPRISS